MGYTAYGYDVPDNDPNCIITESRFEEEYTAWLDEQDYRHRPACYEEHCYDGYTELDGLCDATKHLINDVQVLSKNLDIFEARVRALAGDTCTAVVLWEHETKFYAPIYLKVAIEHCEYLASIKK